MRTSKLIPIACLLLLSACSSTYFAALEQIGIHKRDLVVKRVLATKTAQEDAKEQFTSALDRFRSVVITADEPLQTRYEQLKSELDASEASAKRVTSRINDVEDVGEALFKEWQSELEQFSDQRLRRASEDTLRKSRRKYDSMIDAMRRSEDKLEPVLKPLRDNVLFLKHNLNARAVSALDAEVISVANNVESLIRELEQSISESEQFVKEMEAS